MADREPPIDALTVCAVAVIAFILPDLLHEGLGHGGACLLVGAHPTILTSTFLNYDDSMVSDGAQRFVSAAGAVVNALFGIAAALLTRRARAPVWRYFLWLFAAFNLLDSFGYLLYSAIGGGGDWSVVLDGLPWFARVAEGLIGALLYFVVAPRLLEPGLLPFVGGGDDRVARARRLTLVPYLVGGATAVASGIFNPLGVRILLISAVAAGLGGPALLAWYFPLALAKRSGPAATLGVPRSVVACVVAALTLAVFVGVLGRGIHFDR